MTDDTVSPTSPPGLSARARYAGAILTGAIVLLWLVVLWPAYQLGGRTGVEGASWAAALSLVPGWLVFAALGLYRAAAPAVAQIVLGLVLRMGVVLGGFLVLKTARDEFGTWNFTVWLLVFYLASLAVETWCLAGDAARESGSATAEAISKADTN